jgi:hypothetical protein
LVGFVDDSLGQKKPRSQFKIVSRSPHSDAEWSAIYADFKWFLRRQIVYDAAYLSIAPLDNVRDLKALLRWMQVTPTGSGEN